VVDFCQLSLKFDDVGGLAERCRFDEYLAWQGLRLPATARLWRTIWMDGRRRRALSERCAGGAGRRPRLPRFECSCPSALLPHQRQLSFKSQKSGLPCCLQSLGEATTMRSRVRRFAHFLERIGLAMAGAASGLFVAAHVGSSIAWFTSQGFVLIMMISGAFGFYLGIDTPPLPFHSEEARSRNGLSGKVDSAEFLSAVGTFLAALTAFASVCVIVFRSSPHIAWTTMIMIGWVLGVTLQIIAGAIARARE
jgi:hypothetical protein